MIRGILIGLVVGYIAALFVVSVHEAKATDITQCDKQKFLTQHYAQLIDDMGIIPVAPMPSVKPWN